MSVAATYAEALYGAAKEAGAVDAVAGDLRSLVESIGTSPDVLRLIESPDVAVEAKKGALAGIFAERNPTLANFLKVVLDRGRASDLPDIAKAFTAKVDDAEGRIAVEAITAVPLPDDLRQKILDKVQRETGRTPFVTERVDPEIVGGLILRVGSVMLDASVRRHLDAMGRGMSRAPIRVDS